MAHILIVEDDIHISDLLEETLKSEGYTVSRAFSGTEALLKKKKKKPDLILLDLMLPGLSGDQLLPLINDIPVIVVSAKADVESKVNLLLSGAVDYVTKPFDMNELLARITVRLRTNNKNNDSRELKFKDLRLNTDTHTANEAIMHKAEISFLVSSSKTVKPLYAITISTKLKIKAYLYGIIFG